MRTAAQYRNAGRTFPPTRKSQVWTATLLAAALCALLWATALPGSRAADGWTVPLNLSDGTVDAEVASIAVDTAGRVHVVWSAGGEVLHRAFADARWSAPSRVGSGTSPDVAAEASDGVHLVYVDAPLGASDVYFASWHPATGWTAPLNVSESQGFYTASDPRLALCFDGRVAAVWTAQTASSSDIYVAWSDDGVLWPSLPLPNAHGSHPTVVFGSAGELQVAWQGAYDEEGSLGEIYFCAQENGLWGLPQLVSDSPAVDSLLPSLAEWQGVTYVTWQENAASGRAVYVSSVEGGWWEAPQKRSGASPSYAPTVAFDAVGVGHLAWSTLTVLQHATWSPLTGVWSSIEDIAGSQSSPLGVRLAVAQAAHAVWVAGAAPLRRDVFYSTSSAAPSATATPTLTPTGTTIVSPTATLTAIPTLTATPTTTPPQVSHRVFLPAIRRNWLDSR